VNEAAKGDDTAADWAPPDPNYHCHYASTVVTVKTTYGLSTTQVERDSLARLRS
jgi:hypothetical protein